jgi:hypothetical protein
MLKSHVRGGRVLKPRRHSSDSPPGSCQENTEVIGSRGWRAAFTINASQPMCDSAVPAAHGGLVYPQVLAPA